MKFFKIALVHITLAASTIAASDRVIVDDTKAAKSLRGKKKGIVVRRGLKSAKGDEGARAWNPSPWEPNHGQPNPNPWEPAPDPWYPSDDYVEPDPWNPDPWHTEPPDPWYPGEGDDNVEPDPWNPQPWSPEAWEPEADPWAPDPKYPRVQQWLKKQKGAKGTKGSKSDPNPWYPEYPESLPPHDHPDQCKYFKIKLGAIQAPSQVTVGTATDVGAEFIYNSPLFEDTALTVPVGDPNTPSAFVTGVCTRFQQSMAVEGTNNTIAGAGSCGWTYTINIDGLEGTVEVSGEVFDSVKSTLSIGGGTEVFVGAVGQLELIPSPKGSNLDVFTAVDYYNISALIYIKECDPRQWTWWKNHPGYWDWSGYEKGNGNAYGHDGK